MSWSSLEPLPSLGGRMDGSGQWSQARGRPLVQSSRKASITASWRLLCPPAKKRPTVRILLRSAHGWPSLRARPLRRRRDHADRRGGQPVVPDKTVDVAANELRVDPDLAEFAQPVARVLDLVHRASRTETGVGRRCGARRRRVGGTMELPRTTANRQSHRSTSSKGRGVATTCSNPNVDEIWRHPNGAVRAAGC